MRNSHIESDVSCLARSDARLRRVMYRLRRSDVSCYARSCGINCLRQLMNFKRRSNRGLTLRWGYCSPNPPNPLSPEERGKNRGLPPLRPCLGLRPSCPTDSDALQGNETSRVIWRLRAFYYFELPQDFIKEM